ncbi:MAG TPA: phosphopantothenoylcysteine decarboxylase [Candidatus Dormibacteraeota bacterium]|nr:phosphopantothenoylcysteine decarboxylase [Candidatus Dormibacteraeota bacterium]
MAEAPSLTGRTVVVTAGGTREPIDAVRYLGNRSSGRMGNAIALAAAERGADVVLVTTMAAASHPRIRTVAVETAAQMHDAVRAALGGAAALVMAAAVADYRPAQVAARKLKKQESLTLELIPTVDILRSLADDPARRGVLMVGFAAETDDLHANAMSKLVDKRLDLIVLNDVAQPAIGMNSEDNEVTVFDAGGVVTHISRRAKAAVATALVDVVVARLAPGQR